MTKECPEGPLERLVICRREPVGYASKSGIADPYNCPLVKNSHPAFTVPLYAETPARWKIDSEPYDGGVCYSICDTSTGSSICFYSDSDSIEDRFMCHFLRSFIEAGAAPAHCSGPLEVSRPALEADGVSRAESTPRHDPADNAALRGRWPQAHQKTLHNLPAVLLNA